MSVNRSLKILVILATILFTNAVGYAQVFAGEWKGSDILEPQFNEYLYNSTTKLYFKPVNDSDYLVYSYCRGKTNKGIDTVVVAKVLFKRISEDSIYLEETEVLKPKDPMGNCLVKMYLKLVRRKNEMILEGDYSSNQVGCHISGRYVFRKVIKKE